MMNATQEQAKAKTSVFWDIKSYPVPPWCDAGAVARCVNQYLKKLGFSGPLTIIAVGQLTDVPDDVLRRVSWSGIVLNHVPLGDVGIARSMNAWKQAYPAPTNMMLISSNPSILPRIRSRYSSGCNIFHLFPDESLWKGFLLQDSGEDKCSVTPESAYWLCSACLDLPVSQGYEKFTTHLSCQEHQRKAKGIELSAMCNASVVWDINGCPVPPGCDARRVLPCIEQYLKDFGFFGRITITAVGLLTDVDQDVLRALSSTGIALTHIHFSSIFPYFYLCPPAPTILVICPYSEVLAKIFDDLLEKESDMIQLFPCNYPYSESLWKEFLLDYSGTSAEDKFSKTGMWDCLVCDDIGGFGFDNFITHLQGHEPEPAEELDEPVTVFWNISGYPVPSVCDSRLVLKCIAEYLVEIGFPGHLTINAIGRLADVPPDVQEALSSTGINLIGFLCDSAHVIYHWASCNPPPANVMVICPHSDKVRSDLTERGYFVIVPFRYDWTYSKCPWEHLLLTYSTTEILEEEDDADYENACVSVVIERKTPGWISPTPVYQSDEKDRDKAPLDSLPVDATTMVS